MSTKILLFKHKTLSNGKHPVILQVISNRKRKKISLGYQATEKEWHEEKSRFRRNVENYEQKNIALRRYELLAQRLIDDAILAGKPLSLVEFKRKFMVDQTSSTNFFEFAEELIDEMQQSGKIGNMNVYRNVTNSLKAFADKTLNFEDISVTFLHKWEVWLIGDKRDKKGVAPSTANQYMRTVSAIFNKAISRDIIAYELYPFRNQFNPKGYSYAHLKSEPNHRALSEGELEKFKNFDKQKYPEFIDAHNYFMFMYYCRGINWTDFCHLKPSNIKNGRLIYTRQKTGKLFSIKMSEPLEKIIEYYKGGKYLFPVLSSFHKTPTQKANRIKKCIRQINRDLKEMAIRIGIDPDISTYTARHTYAMSLKRAGVKLGLISDAMGHADSKVTRHYLSSFEDDQIDETDVVL
jgi:integrase